MSLFATAISLSMMAAAGPGADEHAPIKVTKAGSAASAAGPASYFTAPCASMRHSRPMRPHAWAVPR